MNIKEINQWLSANVSGVLCWQKGCDVLMGIPSQSLSGYVKVITPKNLSIEQLPELLIALAPSLDVVKGRLLHLAELQISNKAAIVENTYVENWEKVIDLAECLSVLKDSIAGLTSLVAFIEACNLSDAGS